MKIPAGHRSRHAHSLAGEGEPSPNGGPPGDCYCVLTLTEHPLFERDGQDLVCRVPISYAQAALGAKIEVPTLEGPEEIEIPRRHAAGRSVQAAAARHARPAAAAAKAICWWS